MSIPEDVRCLLGRHLTSARDQLAFGQTDRSSRHAMWARIGGLLTRTLVRGGTVTANARGSQQSISAYGRHRHVEWKPERNTLISTDRTTNAEDVWWAMQHEEPDACMWEVVLTRARAHITGCRRATPIERGVLDNGRFRIEVTCNVAGEGSHNWYPGGGKRHYRVKGCPPRRD